MVVEEVGLVLLSSTGREVGSVLQPENDSNMMAPVVIAATICFPFIQSTPFTQANKSYIYILSKIAFAINTQITYI